MGTLTVRLADVGEGVAEAELVEWNVAVGETIREDDLLGAVCRRYHLRAGETGNRE